VYNSSVALILSVFDDPAVANRLLSVGEVLENLESISRIWWIVRLEVNREIGGESWFT
jgi:hypothetical protein